MKHDSIRQLLDLSLKEPFVVPGTQLLLYETFFIDGFFRLTGIQAFKL